MSGADASRGGAERSDTAATIVEHAIAALDLDVESSAEVPESHSSTVRVLRLRGGSDAVLKIPYTVVKMRRERTALESLAHLPFVPRVLGSFESEGGRCGLLMSRLPGVLVASHVDCTPYLAASIGRALARIHCERMGTAPGVPKDASWAETLRGRFAEYLPLCAEAVPDHPWARIADAFHAALATLPESAEPSLVHSDFRIGNILHDGDEVTGVVDFESSRNGERPIDFLKLAHGLWDPAPHLREPLLAGYREVLPVPEQLDELRPFHELFSGVACVAWSARRRQTATAFCDENLSRSLRALESLER